MRFIKLRQIPPLQWLWMTSLVVALGLTARVESVDLTAPEDACLGTWEVEQKSAKVYIFKQSGKFFGKITWLKRPNEPNTGKAKVDRHNSDPALRSRPILGMVIVKNMTYDPAEKEWKNGTVYDPNSGRNYECTMWMPNAKEMKLRGYWGIIYSTSTWSRVD